jgi:hypothetical protein
MPYTAKDSPYAPGPNGETSHAAAKHADENREQKRRLYLKLLYRLGPLQDHEAAAAYCWPLSSICSIRNGLMLLGLVERGTEKRLTQYGHLAWVWQLTEAGRAAVQAMAPQLESRPTVAAGHDLNSASEGRLL